MDDIQHFLFVVIHFFNCKMRWFPGASNLYFRKPRWALDDLRRLFQYRRIHSTVFFKRFGQQGLLVRRSTTGLIHSSTEITCDLTSGLAFTSGGSSQNVQSPGFESPFTCRCSEGLNYPVSSQCGLQRKYGFVLDISQFCHTVFT